MLNMERTSDSEIINLSMSENRIIITKDKDFLDSHILQKPNKLLLVISGNIKNNMTIRN